MPGVKPDELARLQHQLLAAALGGPPLPGGGVVMLPDLQFVRAGAEVVLSQANLASAVRLDDLPEPVRAADQPQGAWLEFAPVQQRGDHLTLALQVRATPPRGDRPLPLSAVTVEFERGPDGWIPSSPPAAMAT